MNVETLQRHPYHQQQQQPQQRPLQQQQQQQHDYVINNHQNDGEAANRPHDYATNHRQQDCGPSNNASQRDREDIEYVQSNEMSPDMIAMQQMSDEQIADAAPYQLDGRMCEPKPHKPSVLTRTSRTMKYPFLWAYHRSKPGKEQLNELKIYSKHLPRFFVISPHTLHEILPFVKKHVITLSDGTMVVAELDLSGCRDSYHWFKKWHKKLLITQILQPMPYSIEVIHELNLLSSREFGVSLWHLWKSTKSRAEDEIRFNWSVRKNPE